MTIMERAREREWCAPRSCALVLAAPLLFACGEEGHFDPKVPENIAARAPIEEQPNEAALRRDAQRGRHDTFAASPGFTPDPWTHPGRTDGAAIDAHQLDERCHGWVAIDPDFVVEADRPFAELTLRIDSREDTTLFVVGPDGEARCANDEDGQNPVLRGPFGRGVHRIWVGARRRETNHPYVFALSELDAS